MRDDINNNTDKKMNVIKQDVSFIKNSLKGYSDRLEETENRIGEAEDRLDRMEGLGSEVDIIRELLEKHIEQTNKEACMARKDNVIVNGLPGFSKDPVDAIEMLKNCA